MVSSQKKDDLAPVGPSGKEQGKELALGEVIQYFKSFYIAKPYVSIVGGLVTNGKTKGDIDIYIARKERDKVTEFRISRMLPEELASRVHFLYPDENEATEGVYTSNIELYDLKLERKEEKKIELMSVEDSVDKVELFKFCKLLKPASGRYKGELYSIESLIELVDEKQEWYEKGIYVQKKFDGVHVRCDVQRNYESGVDVKIWTEEGNEITSKLPTLRKALGAASKGHAMALVGELEVWKDKKHQSRQQTTAIIHTKDVHPDEGKTILNVFDIIFYNKEDIHSEPYTKRLELLRKRLGASTVIQIAQGDLVGNAKDLHESVKRYAKLPGSEGAYLKRADFPYELDGKTSLNIKYKNTFSIDAEVKDIHKVSGAESWNYLCTIRDGKRDVPIGRTYNTSIKLKEGDIVKVEFCNLNKYFDVKLKRGWYNWWSPRVIMARKDKKRPDNVDTADQLVKASNGEIKNRRASIALDGDPYMTLPAEDKKILGMAHIHSRGKSVHIDLRFGVTKDWAVGWTLYIPKGLSKVPETFTEAKTLVDKEIMPLVKEKLKDPTQKFNCGTKAVEPIEWLDYQGRVEKGEVGATKNELGYFYIIDRFDAEFGAQKCMVGKTQLIVKDEDGHIKRADIRSIVKQKRNVSVLTPTGFAGIKDYVTIPVDFDALREIKLDNGSSIKCDDNHPSFCLRDNQIYKLPAKEIKEGDLIPIFSDGYDGAGGNYNMGRFIGLYLAEGSIAKSSKQLMSFAFHERETEYISFIAQYAAAFGARSILRMTKESSGIHVELSQAGGLIGLIDQFIKREDKSLRSNVFGLCRECRQGVIDGMHEGDNNDTPSVKYSEIAQGQPHLELGKDIHQLLFSLGNVASLKYNTQSIRKYGTRVAIAYDLTNFTKGWWHQYAINGQLFIKVKKIKKLNKWDVGNTVKELFDVELEGDHRIVLANGIITSNSHYHEYFCDGKIFDGRFCVRLLENKEEWKKTGEGLMTWMASTALTDKTPYVLGRRAVTKKWAPPYGHSALPEKIRSKVPKEYQYWNSRDPKKRLEIRDALIEEIKKTRISIDALGPVSYKVLKQTFKKQTVIREGPTRTRYFFIICKDGVQKLSLAFLNNPLEQNELTGIKTKLGVKLCGYKGHENQVKPGTELNKTKATPSNIEVLEAGKATALVDRAVKEYKLKEGKMKGNWIMYNEEEGSAMWVLKRIVRAS